ncbi:MULTISPECIES: hypothetical protein [Microvirga]|uniref:hypothetical protein n=1 Tax=Microvirga TaxID=186650 RepID=UPI0021C7806A|nr:MULTISPECIES: hypothetical protein [unclassified Microvirga]
MNLPRMMLHLPATGELLDVKALEEGEILGLNEGGHLLQWGVEIGIYTPQETPEEFGAHNVRPHELRRLKLQVEGPTADLLYPLSTQDKNTVIAALFHYHEDGLGEPFKRSNEVHLLASGEAEDLNEDISLDQDGVQELLDRLRHSDGVVPHAPPPVPFDPAELSHHDLCLALEEMRRRGWAVAAYDVNDVDALISDSIELAPTDEEIRTWLKDNQDDLQDRMCAAMHEAINAEWNRRGG